MAKFLLLVILCAGPLHAAPWPGVAYTEVRAFSWRPEAETENLSSKLIRPDFSLMPGVIKPEGTPLRSRQIARVLAAQARRDRGRSRAACYNPHHVFLFYNAAHQPVASFEICFECLGCTLVPADPGSDPDYQQLRQIFVELRIPTD